MVRQLLPGLLMALSPTLTSAPSFAQWTEDEQRRLHALIRPSADEDAFSTIPWQTSLWEARVLAAAQGKPILLWEMDGHPLGCG